MAFLVSRSPNDLLRFKPINENCLEVYRLISYYLNGSVLFYLFNHELNFIHVRVLEGVLLLIDLNILCLLDIAFRKDILQSHDTSCCPACPGSDDYNCISHK